MSPDRAGVDSPRRVAAVRAPRLLETGPEEAFNRLTRLAAILLGTSMVALTVVDDVRSFLKGAPHPEAMTGRDGIYEAPVYDAACHVVIDAGDEICAPDVSLEPRLRDLPQIKEFEAAAWLGVPILDPDGYVVGNFCAMDRVVREWTDEHREALRGLALVAGGEIALRRALADAARATAEAERHAAEAEELAWTLQASLLPPRPPRLPGATIGARFEPGGTGVEVMGDFWDVVPVPGGFGLVVGDVCGKGAAAARTTALARSAVRTAVLGEPADGDGAAVLRTLNDVLLGWFSDPIFGGRVGFVSATYCTFRRPVAGGAWQVDVAGAGHPPGLVRRAAGAVEHLTGGGMILGLTPGAVVGSQRLELGPGDALVLYTDGVTEAHRVGDPDQFDETGLAAVLADLPAGTGPQDTAEALVDAARSRSDGRSPDDAGVVVVRIGNPDPTGR
ncbi:SpoIIE family protein phosphatase [Pseudonocardia kujensis]|uniref:GAF domain-containing SpoIIE family protein phosphatase n=1 Tax=Pseudonocardia kujensis TaxID=1128675 RepID=UPI001E43B580|nr:GAF domain-containing SpoIIE family protein phosphatase [Pseudonocardia kujensis]MCE0766892.1 SpoIIE family protein phosphatase [Pseudonocardia kujensis]